MALFYTTTNGTLNGRASYGYSKIGTAAAKAEQQNMRAQSMGIKARYSVAEAIAKDIPEREWR